MKRLVCIYLAALCLVLAGCDWMEGNYHSVTLHEAHAQSSDNSDMSAGNYRELCDALESMVAAGREKGIIYVTEYDQSRVSSGMTTAVRNTLTNSPLGAYAVEEITFDLGTNGGKSAVAVEITYIHGRREIQRIQQLENMEQAQKAIFTALKECDSGLVLWVERYTEQDFTQLVDDYAELYPQYMMEVPQVVASTYPERGSSRILELKFSYQNSREDLRKMQSYVTAIFEAAGLYVSSDDTDAVKLSQLYSFLMERFDYQVDTSITPSYSLLRHGVGDSKAFAMVYAAMCRQAGLECHVVTGTRGGEPWYWNIVLDGENGYHVDLLRCSEQGGLAKLTDGAMTGYVWDYSAYPRCPDPEQPARQEPETGMEPEPTESEPEEETQPSTDEITEPETEAGTLPE